MISSNIKTTGKENVKSLQDLISKTSKELNLRTIKNYKYKSASNWYAYSLYYLSATKNLVNYIDKINENSENNNYDERKGSIIPTYFLFKHTLELVLKFIYISLNFKNIITHDISEIFENIKINELEKKFNWINISKELNRNEEELKQLLKKYFKILEELSDNYLFHVNLLSSIKKMNFVIVDEENEIFKYPRTNKVKFQIDPISLYDLTKKEIDKLKVDFIDLNNCFNVFQLFFYYSNQIE